MDQLSRRDQQQFDKLMERFERDKIVFGADVQFTTRSVQQAEQHHAATGKKPKNCSIDGLRSQAFYKRSYLNVVSYIKLADQTALGKLANHVKL